MSPKEKERKIKGRSMIRKRIKSKMKIKSRICRESFSYSSSCS